MEARLPAPLKAATRLGGGLSVVLLWMILVAPNPARGADDGAHDRVRALVRSGATQLALRIIDQIQPPPGQGGEWAKWERERLVLYGAQGEWTLVAARVLNYPDDVPGDFLNWARTQAALAELEAGRPDDALRFLRQLLWSGQGSNEDRATWRQLVIRSYLAGEHLEDAKIALARYRADWQVDSSSWRILEASILLRLDRPKAAYLSIARVKTHEGRVLALLSALRAGIQPPVRILNQAMTLAAETGNKPATQLQAWLVAADAASRAGNRISAIHALERALTLVARVRTRDGLLSARADDLWAAYMAFAESTGNERRLLVGDDSSWLAQAESYRRDDAVQARAFYAFLVLRAASPQSRQMAAGKLADSLIEDGRGEVLRALFASSRHFPLLMEVPESVRYRLAELALDRYDIEFAARLMGQLQSAPDGQDPDYWTLRRARVLVYAGHYADAAQLLELVYSRKPTIPDDVLDRLLQVVFDLQAAKQHSTALDILQSVRPRVRNDRAAREILYWMAESRAALGEYQRAAELFLQSANYRHPTGGDMWGQTARFHAAESLGKAGLTQDARLVFEALLKHTGDAKQRAVIERSIQQLWLIEKRSTVQ